MSEVKTAMLIDLIRSDATMIGALETVRALELPDCWISAGFVRNRVWDHLHGYAEPTPLNDIDVIYFDPERVDADIDQQLDAELCRRQPGRPWQVKNQVRMAERNGDRPYRSIDDALEHWCETPTAIGVRLDRMGQIKITAPFGLADLFEMVAKPTPYARSHPHKLAQYRERMAKKNWPRHWPRIKVLEL